MRIWTTLLVCSALLATGVPAAEPEGEGYRILLRACGMIEALDLGERPGVMEELTTFVDRGGEPGGELPGLMEQAREAMSLIRTTDSDTFSGLMDGLAWSASTEVPWPSHWLNLNRIATAQAILLRLDGDPGAAMEFLDPFNVVGMEIARKGPILPAMVHITVRSMQYPVLVSSIDNLPESALAGHLAVAKERYRRTPTMDGVVGGEFDFAVNTAREMFETMLAEEELAAARVEMIRTFRESGLDEEDLTRIEAGEALSLSQWESRVLDDIARIRAMYEGVISTIPSAELSRLDEAVWDDIERMGEGAAAEEWMAQWKLLVEGAADGMSLADAEELHERIGGAISHKFLSMMPPPYGRVALRHREVVASERLLLIRLAARLHAANTGRNPESLQQLVDVGLLEGGMIIDPLSGEEFRLRTGPSFEAYGVGRNLADNGGVPWDPRTGEGDTVLVPLEKWWEFRRDSAD